MTNQEVVRECARYRRRATDAERRAEALESELVLVRNECDSEKVRDKDLMRQAMDILRLMPRAGLAPFQAAVKRVHDALRARLGEVPAQGEEASDGEAKG